MMSMRLETLWEFFLLDILPMTRLVTQSETPLQVKKFHLIILPSVMLFFLLLKLAALGKQNKNLKKEGVKYKVGRAELKDTGMGGALQENGLAKVLTDERGEKILGVHIVGPQASILIHEAIVAMKANRTVKAITDSVYIHPALPEWLQRAFFAIE